MKESHFSEDLTGRHRLLATPAHPRFSQTRDGHTGMGAVAG